MIRTRRIGERFSIFGNEFVVEAAEEKPCNECHFHDAKEGSCMAKPNVTGFCYKDFRTDSKQVRFRRVKSFAQKCKELGIGYDHEACRGNECERKYSCQRFMLYIKAKMEGVEQLQFRMNTGKWARCYLKHGNEGL